MSHNEDTKNGENGSPPPPPVQDKDKVPPGPAPANPPANPTPEQVACTARINAGTLVNGWLKDLSALLEDQSDKVAVSSTLQQLNESMEDYTAAHMDYVALIEDMDVKAALREEYDQLKAMVDKVGSQAVSHIHHLAQPPPINDNRSVHTSASSASSRAKTAAKKAALLVRRNRLAEIQRHQLDEQKAKMKLEQLQLDVEIEATEAEEQALAEEEQPPVQSPVQPPIKPLVQPTGQAKISEQCLPAKQVKQVDSEVFFATDRSNGVDNSGSSAMANANEDMFFNQQRQLINLLHAPKVEIPTFAGDPLKYYEFIRAFEDNVERYVTDSASRLTRLLQSCAGRAKAQLQGCNIMPPDLGYQEARRLLKERYGNKLVITQAWISHVTSHAAVKANDGPGLQEFADLLRTCQHTLLAMGALAELNTQRSLAEVVAKLPPYLQTRWRKDVVRITRDNAPRMPAFNDLVLLVEMAAEEANIPMFGSVSTTKTEQQNDSKSRPKRQTGFNTSVKSEDSSDRKTEDKCEMCDNSHKLWECADFKALSRDQRFDFVKKKHLCFNCLKGGGHGSRQCRSPRRCPIKDCGRKHSPLLHSSNQNASSSSGSQSSELSQASEQPKGNLNLTATFIDTSCHFTGAGNEKTIALPIVAVKVYSPDNRRSIKSFALIDSGSTSCFVNKHLMTELGIEGELETVNLTTLEKCDSTFVATVASNLQISDINGTNVVRLPAVYARDNLTINPENMVSYEDIAHWPHLAGVDLPLVNSSEVGLIIGQDCPEALTPIDIVRGGRGEPWASRSVLGWSVNGPLKKNIGASRKRLTSNYVSGMTSQANDLLSQQVERFWKIDSSGLFDDKQQMSIEDCKVTAMWDKTTYQKDGHYVMGIPLRDNTKPLPNNRQLAQSRLDSLARKLSKNPELKAKYNDGINDLLVKGYAVPVADEEVQPGKVWYLPHHAVISPTKEKIRIVFDAAAKYGGVSLNSLALPGPDLTNRLIGVLLRFREGKFCIMADIEAMFHQVFVDPPYRDLLRFLWWPNGDMRQPPATFKMTVHLFGGTWSPSACTYALRKTIQDHGQGFSALTTSAVHRHFYVDDLLQSCESIDQAVQLSSELKQLLAMGGFNLTKFISNSNEVLQQIPESDRSKKVKDLSLDTPLSERALGVYWDIDSDTLGYKLSIKDKPMTKRGILSILSSLYDPLGLASPFILKARKVIQDLFRKDVGWDEPIPEEQRQEWEDWASDLPNMVNVRFPRWVKTDQFAAITRAELHNFADASFLAYGIVSYLRLENEEGEIHSTIVTAKARLSPIKQMTIPRLELAAATLAVRQNTLLQRELDMKIDQVYYWTDSTIVLQYIRSESKRFHTYVANRLAVIRDASTPAQWRHVDTKQNPADLTSRGLNASELNSSYWQKGPAFLSLSPANWPNDPTLPDVQASDPEIKAADKVKVAGSMTAFTNKVSQLTPTDKLLNYFSSWKKLKRAVAWLLTIKNVLAHKQAPTHHLSAADLDAAEHAIVGYIQAQCFDEEITAVAAGRKVKDTSPLIKLNPVIREGVLCVSGRLKHGCLPENVKFPALLPRDHHAVTAYIRSIHEENGHVGREHVLAETRTKYWVIGGRQTVRSILRSCIVCRKGEAPTMQQKMADLPPERVIPGGPAFTHVGVDLFGPFFVKRGRGREKRYGCLFTCMNVRAVHIEVLHSLEADAFLNGLNRFIARRGCPASMRSDNGTNFVGAARELHEEVMSCARVRNQMADKGIKWKFNTPLASHAGGVWERQIRSMRRVLSRLMTEQVLTDEQLRTLMCTAEAIVNSRPITSVSCDPQDLEALTPSHLLIMRPVRFPPGHFNDSDLSSRKKWRQVQYMADLFWRRWTREYLPQLQERSKWAKEQKQLTTGDLVLVKDTNLPRNEWIMGRVTECLLGRDGLCRSVRMRTNKGELVRPITKVCFLESPPTIPARKQPVHHQKEE